MLVSYYVAKTGPIFIKSSNHKLIKVTKISNYLLTDALRHSFKRGMSDAFIDRGI